MSDTAPIRWAFVVAALALAAYASNLGNDFAMDDRYNVVDNPQLRSLAAIPGHFTQAWAGHVQGGIDEAINRSYWRPITATSWTIDYALFGLSPFGYHLINNLLHALISALMVWWLWRLCANRRVAVTAGVIFALHPLHTEAVNLVTYRTELLAALWCLLALGLRAGPSSAGPSSTGLTRLAPVALCYALGLGSKEIAVTLPGWLLLQDWAMGRVTRKNLRQLAPLYLSLSLILASYLVIRGALLSNNPMPFFGALSVTQTIGSVMKIHAFYLQKWLLPYPLNPFWDMSTLQPALSLADPMAVLGAAALLGSVGWALRSLWRGQDSKWPALGVLCWWLGLLPVSHLVPIPVGAGERFTYLPSIGACLACSALIDRAWSARWRSPVLVATVAWCVVAGGWTAARGLHWHNDETLMRQVIADMPHSFNGHHLLGQLLYDDKRCAEALKEFRAAEQILPGFAPNQPWLARAQRCAR